jgi:hypothetical protein
MSGPEHLVPDQPSHAEENGEEADDGEEAHAHLGLSRAAMQIITAKPNRAIITR